MKEFKGTIMGFFTDCPKCGQKTNREGLQNVLEEVCKQHRQEIKEKLKNLKGIDKDVQEEIDNILK